CVPNAALYQTEPHLEICVSIHLIQLKIIYEVWLIVKQNISIICKIIFVLIFQVWYSKIYL
ncbi:MAG TPA: hypothetical protein DCZ02_05070, partial [Ruminococcaceae bacterium]|nr:hypothetical protein [Oscillospiraceae bacterium]